MIANGKSTSAFTTFTKKAGTALKSLGAAMASMAIKWAIGKVIEKDKFAYRKRVTNLFDYSFCVYKILCTNIKLLKGVDTL